jgi:transposase
MHQQGVPSKVYVGIDVHRSLHKAAIIPLALMKKGEGNWKKVKPLSVANNRSDFERLDYAIKDHSQDPSQVSIAIDHTGGHYSAAIVNFLTLKGYRLWYLEGKALKEAKSRFLDQENKTDEIDAASMARMLYARDVLGDNLRISAVSPDLTSEAATMRALCIQRWALTKLITQATNRLRQLLVASFPEGEISYFAYLARIVTKYPTREAILDGDLAEFKIPKTVKDAIKNAAADSVGISTPSLATTIKYIARQRLDIISKKKELTVEIENLVRSHPCGPILTSFPGLGGVGAATLIGVIRDIDRWASKKCLRKALGVYPTIARSGQRSGHSVMGREGSAEARRVLWQMVMANISGKAKPNTFRDYYQRKVTKGMKRKPALVATMGKACEIIYHCLKEGEHYSYGQTETLKQLTPEPSKKHISQLEMLSPDVVRPGAPRSPEEADIYVISSLATR